jgi:multiple sugar transport system substrate-binding protein
MKKLIAGFEKKYPNITVQPQLVPQDTATDKVLTQIAGNNAPDVALLDMGAVGEFAQRNALADLSGYIAGSSNIHPNDFVAAWSAANQYQGRFYGLPFDGETTGLFYRTDMFQAAGITSPPKTWAEMAADAKKLTDASKKQYGFEIFAPEAWYYWYPFLYQAGGELVKNDKIVFDSPAAKRSADFYIGLRKYSPPDYFNSNSYDGRVAFANGKVGMYIAGSWFAGVMEDEFPEIHGKWAAAPLPQDKKCATTIAGDSLMMFDQSKNKDAAWLFLQYLDDPKNVQYYTAGSKTSTELPPLQSLLDDPKTYSKNPVLKGFADMMPCGININIPNPNWYKVEQNVLAAKLGEAVYGKVTPSEALDAAAKEGQPILDQA